MSGPDDDAKVQVSIRRYEMPGGIEVYCTVFRSVHDGKVEEAIGPLTDKATAEQQAKDLHEYIRANGGTPTAGVS